MRGGSTPSKVDAATTSQGTVALRRCLCLRVTVVGCADPIHVKVPVAPSSAIAGFRFLVRSGKEPHPPALLRPYVTVSRHTA
jgi:hypothetical protein